jgi:simple sugar transport system permease protein
MTITTETTKKTNRNFFRTILVNRYSSLTIAVVMAVVFTCVLIAFMKADPLAVFAVIFKGSRGSMDAFRQVLQAWVPLVLASCGLMFTFTSGLVNIGMEGQIEMGAIFATAWFGSSLAQALPAVLSSFWRF